MRSPSLAALSRLAPLLIVWTVFLAFHAGLANGFVNLDDRFNFLGNPHYRGLGWSQLRWMWTTFHGAHYQPVTWMTWGFDYLVWGLNPFGYHLGNLLIHCANVALFYFLSLFLLAGGARDGSARLGAAFAALFFGVHPLRVESVSWATERRDVLSAFFYLASLWAYVRGQSGRGRAAALGLFIAALLSKVTALTLPAVLVVLDFYPLGRLPPQPRLWFSPRSRHVWLEKIPFVLAGLGAGVVGLFAQASTPALVSLWEAGLESRLAQAVYGLGFYLWKTAIPLRLSPWYGASTLPSGGFIALEGAALLAAAAALFFERRSRPWALAAFAYYGIVLFPSLGVVKSGVQVAADRFSYLPSLSWALLAGAALRAGLRRGRGAPAFLGAAAAVVVALGTLTWRQTRIWHDSVTLWMHALSVDSRSGFEQINLAVGLIEENRNEEAVRFIEPVIASFPDGKAPSAFSDIAAQAHNNAALARIAEGRLDEAAVHLGRAVELSPRFVDIRANWGLVLESQGLVKQAIEQYEQALRLNPSYKEARDALERLRQRVSPK